MELPAVLKAKKAIVNVKNKPHATPLVKGLQFESQFYSNTRYCSRSSTAG